MSQRVLALIPIGKCSVQAFPEARSVVGFDEMHKFVDDNVVNELHR